MKLSPKAELCYPFVFGVLALITCWYFKKDLGNDPTQLLSATVSFGAIVFGFVGTSLSILTSLNTPVMRKIRRTRYLKLLRKYLGWALLSGILLSLVSIIGMFFSFTALWFSAIWCATLIFCIACLWRLARVMLLLFSDHENVSD